MRKADATFDVLGSEWRLFIGDSAEFPYLEDMDGYTDKTERFIVVSKPGEDCQLADYQWYQKKIIRHEVIHAFLFESGLHENMSPGISQSGGHPELLVDWVAVQFPKILKVYQELDVL